MLCFDLVVAADPRQAGADGRCLAALLEAAAAAGYRTGLLPLRGAGMGTAQQVATSLRSLFGDGRVSWLDTDAPVQAELLLVYHVGPMLQGNPRQLPVRATRCQLRLDQPATSAADERLFDLASLARRAEAAFGRTPDFIAADPLVAASVPAGAGPELASGIWPPATRLRAGDEAPAGTPRIGRHCLGGAGAIPATAAELLEAYPADGGYEVALAEAAIALARGQPHLPPGWRLFGRELADPQGFLAALQAYVFATDPSWRPYVPAGLVEALAAAPLLVLPPALAPFFGDAAIYMAVGDRVADRLNALQPAALPACRRAAAALHRRVAGPEAVVKRLRTELGPPSRKLPRLALRRDVQAPRNVLFLSPNGVGMGHLTRLLAVARHSPAAIRPVFLSMSQAVGVVEPFGFAAEYFPYHAQTGETAETWSQALRARLNEAIAFYDARCVVFDGNVPYQGLVEARRDNANRPFAWIRRGMWRPEAGRATIDRARHFDLVIEPGEFAAADDAGITAGRDAEALRVAPVTLFEPGELLGREAARAELGLDPGCLAVIVQLGARNNFDYGQVDRVVLDTLGRRVEVQLVFVDWLIGESTAELPDGVLRLQDFPIARYLRAFDLAVSACGYNSFHELLSIGMPAILVPNENPMMDAQEIRALWADRRGHAVCVRAHEAYRLAWALESLLDPDVRRRLAGAADRLRPCDGARETATLIAELAGTQSGADGAGRPFNALQRSL
jgi:hypothetical protein